jgi:allophanate hydrolase
MDRKSAHWKPVRTESVGADHSSLGSYSSFVTQRLVSFDDYLKQHGTSQLHPAVAAIFEKSKGFTAVQAYQDQFKLLGYKRRVEREFRDHLDVLIVPTTVRHWKVEEVDVDPLGRNFELGEFTQFANLVDLCAIAIPVGSWTNDQGRAMPFGITLLAPAGRDEALMQLAERLLPNLPKIATADTS